MNEKVLDILTHGMIIVLKTEIDELFFVCFFASPLAKRGWGGIEPPTSRTLNENHTTRPPARMIWRMRVSIPLPRRCERRTLPIELIPH